MRIDELRSKRDNLIAIGDVIVSSNEIPLEQLRILTKQVIKDNRSYLDLIKRKKILSGGSGLG